MLRAVMLQNPMLGIENGLLHSPAFGLNPMYVGF